MLDRYEDDGRQPRRRWPFRAREADDGAAPDTGGGGRPRWRMLLPLGIVAVAIAVFAVLIATRPKLTPEPPAERVWTVEAEPVSFVDIQPSLRVFGEVVAGRQIELRALVAGEVVETGESFREGGVVDAGQMLVKIDPFDYEAALDEAEAQLAEARARQAEFAARAEAEEQAFESAKDQLAIYRRNLSRAVSLAERGNISKATVDDRRLAVSQQQAAVDQREKNIAIQRAQAEQQAAVAERLEVGVRRAQRDLDNTLIKAPFAGFIGEVAAEVGKRVGLNDRLANITDAERLDVRFTLSDAQYGRLIEDGTPIKGRQAKVIWRVGGRDLEYAAIIERVGATITAASGGVELFARLAETASDTPLRPGAFVEVHLPDRRYERVARLPESALYDGDTVYVIADGRLEPREVAVESNEAGIVLLRGGLEEGDTALTTRFAEAGPGVRVSVRDDDVSVPLKAPAPPPVTAPANE